MKKILFVNGIDVNFGGAGAESLKFWSSQLKTFNCNFFHINPLYFRNYFVNKFLIMLTHFPGFFFRIFNLIIFEFFIKFSFFYIVRFFFIIKKNTYEKYIFSHHSVFYLAFLSKKQNNTFIVHDLIYKRYQTFSKYKTIRKLIFKIELILFNQADQILIQSYMEYRLLKRFYGPKKNIYLIKSYPINLNNSNKIQNQTKTSFYFFSDWRRKENIHGLRIFLETVNNSISTSNFKKINATVYGFGLDNTKGLFANDRLFQIRYVPKLESIDKIIENTLIVPIYRGSGIKLKVLEAYSNYKNIIGTREAFDGLPSLNIPSLNFLPDRDILNFLCNYKFYPTVKSFKKFHSTYNKYFSDINELF